MARLRAKPENNHSKREQSTERIEKKNDHHFVSKIPCIPPRPIKIPYDCPLKVFLFVLLWRHRFFNTSSWFFGPLERFESDNYKRFGGKADNGFVDDKLCPQSAI